MICLKITVLFLVVVNPEDIEMITKTCLEKDDLHRFFRRLLGYGGIFAPARVMKVARFNETFQQAELRRLQQAEREAIQFAIQSEARRQQFANCNYNQTELTTSYMQRYHAQKLFSDLESGTYTEKLLEISEGHLHNNQEGRELIDQAFPKLQQNILDEYWLCERTILYNSVIETKAIELQKDKMSQQNECHHFDLQEFQKKSFLENLINLSGGAQSLTNDELREEILTLIVAATDTSAVAMGYTLILLGKYPKIQDKVYKELNEIFGNSNRPLESEDLNKLKYLERVIKESLRLYPPVPFIIRKIEKEIKLPSGNCLPAGSGAVLSIWGVHRNPKCWGADAEHFDPDRFLPERFKLVKSGSYLPFSIGPRNCLGYQYALMSIKTALSTILRNYKVLGEPESSPIPRIRVKMEIMMKAVDGFNVTLQKRE
ncbi:cytochrome P450 [Danaus plexippus plexippus]|uniref:Cytochrome P450 n=1 Tax=Danaus plexippus plexippus TaxID=278856 RepID=A0A212FEU5_DANPL|nr:cytochrome P450 [Danaus plexippus plexippus]